MAQSVQSLHAHAQVAYQRGDGRAAKELSQRARMQEARVRAVREKATEAAFQHANSGARGAGTGGHGAPPLELDLHGLTAAAALDKLESCMVTLAQLRLPHHAGVRIITGVGHHSAGGARLLPTTRRFLDDGGLRYSEVAPGIIHIPLTG